MLVVARHTRHRCDGELARSLRDLRTQRIRSDSGIATHCCVAAVEGRKGAGVMWLDELCLAAVNDPSFAVNLGGKSIIEPFRRYGRIVGRGLRHSDEVWS